MSLPVITPTRNICPNRMLTNTCNSAGDPATRSFALVGLNVWGSVAVATIPLAVFKVVDQPAVVSGNYTAAAFLLLQASLAILLAYRMYARTQKERYGHESESQSNSAEISVIPEKGLTKP